MVTCFFYTTIKYICNISLYFGKTLRCFNARNILRNNNVLKDFIYFQFNTSNWLSPFSTLSQGLSEKQEEEDSIYWHIITSNFIMHFLYQ